MTDSDTDSEARRRRRVKRAVLLLILAGACVQVLMSAYYLGMTHAPHPRHMPVGYVTTDETNAQVRSALDASGQFAAHSYPEAAVMQAAIRAKKIYGGVDVTTSPPMLYVASAAGPSASSALRTAFTAVVAQQVATQVDQLVAAGAAVPVATVRQLTAAPAVVDVVPLPGADRAGSSIGLLVQCLSLGATVASTGLGRLRGRTSPSLRRGLAHAGTLITYGAASAAAVLLTAHAFGVVPGRDGWRLFGTFLLVSVAITASVAGLVSVVGPAGALLGTIYFVFGVTISGATVLPAFLPTPGRIVGQLMPTGAGATLVRDSLYFPSASVTGPLTVLGLYAAVGIALVLGINAMANRTPAGNLLAEAAE
jgi:hypothetical protein